MVVRVVFNNLLLPVATSDNYRLLIALIMQANSANGLALLKAEGKFAAVPVY